MLPCLLTFPHCLKKFPQKPKLGNLVKKKKKRKRGLNRGRTVRIVAKEGEESDESALLAEAPAKSENKSSGTESKTASIRIK